MATLITPYGITITFDDDKIPFYNWIKADTERRLKFRECNKIFEQRKQEDQSFQIFRLPEFQELWHSWLNYANAVGGDGRVVILAPKDGSESS